jgi:hypothetical protein
MKVQPELLVLVMLKPTPAALNAWKTAMAAPVSYE